MAFRIKVGQSPDGNQPSIQYTIDRQNLYEEAIITSHELKRGSSE